MMDVRVAVWAGVAAGVFSTIVQIALWSAFSKALPALLFTDARMAAAIVMGRDVLPPPATFDWLVVLVATLVHFALSIIYGVILSWLVSPFATPLAAMVGVVFGLLLYAVNMYGFTLLFAWFEADRDWITATSHVAFGVTGALVYKILWQRRSQNDRKRLIEPRRKR